jgi:rhodanese-related sulfurtransferase
MVWCCLLMAMGVGACSQGESDAPEMSPGELSARMASEATPVILDVRTPKEYAAGHLPGAINVPHKALPDRLADILGFRDREVVLYCERGKRSDMATAVLREAGFSSVWHLQGHMVGWRGEGLPEQKGTDP